MARRVVKLAVVQDEKASDARFSDKIEDLRNTFLMCREKGHSWDHVTDKTMVSYKNQVKQISREWICARCTTGCYEEVHLPSFDVMKRKYFYAEGYLLSRKVTNGKRVDIRDIRQEVLIRSGLIKR